MGAANMRPWGLPWALGCLWCLCGLLALVPCGLLGVSECCAQPIRHVSCRGLRLRKEPGAVLGLGRLGPGRTARLPLGVPHVRGLGGQGEGYRDQGRRRR